MNLDFRKLAGLGIASITALGLSACGGGGGYSDEPGSEVYPVVPTAVVSNYYDFNYLQNAIGYAAGQARIVDYGINTTGGSVTFGMPGYQNVSSFAPDANGGGYWGAPITNVVGFSSNANDSLAPAVAMICNSIPNNGIGPNNQTSTDVLVTTSATAIQDPTLLAGLQFNQYYQNCQRSANAPGLGNSIIFNADGSAIFTIPTNTGSATTFSLSAGQMYSLLSGSPLQNASAALEAFTAFSAYRIVSANGLVTYALVEHGSSSQVNPTFGYVGLWFQ